VELMIHFFTTQKAQTLFLSDGISKFKINNTYYDKFCDPICDLKKISPDKAIFFSQLPFTTPNLKKKYFSLLGAERIAYVISRLLIFFMGGSFFLPDYEKFYDYLKEKGLDIHLSQKEVILKGLIIYILSWFFYGYIKFKGVKVCYVVCYYGYLGYGLALACKNLGVSLYDIQHGGIENSPAYHKWNKVPTHGYEITPSHFLFWDEASCNIFATQNSLSFLSSCKHEKLGFPLLCSNIFQESIRKQAEEISKKHHKFEKIILIPLQPQFFGRTDWDQLAHEVSISEEPWLWWIRSHPAYKNDYGLQNIKNLNLNNVFYDNGDSSIYSVLSICDCVVTTASSSIIEAAYFNVPSLIISPTGIEDFDYYIKYGKAHFVPEHHSIINTIKSVIN
jgi:hypothetical protein